MRTSLRVLLIIIICAGGLYGALAAWRVYSYHFDDLPFDRAVWLRNAEKLDNRNPRGQMAQDLRDRVLQKGMTRKEVSLLLGKPDAWAGTPQPKNVLEYNLGNWAWCPLCFDVLDITFDKSGRLTKVEITEH